MSIEWIPDDLQRLGSLPELEISTVRADGTYRRWTPIWVVGVGDQIYVRSWHRRETGWFGDAVLRPRARIRFDGQEREVAVEDLGEASDDVQAAVSGAYAAKYGRTGEGSISGMVTPDALATTLRLVPTG